MSLFKKKINIEKGKKIFFEYQGDSIGIHRDYGPEYWKCNIPKELEEQWRREIKQLPEEELRREIKQLSIDELEHYKSLARKL